ncbi:14629_t:CDS:2 [Funneliformis mosseae]|uniref:14629_t:CDS:1 n=1 Tax=Funneliformis mosseae TaxID=27381 RepID=A0A9N9GVI2_FUNMO|nr:14629_t:CDS:2 [Funneliformis mosseae]
MDNYLYTYNLPSGEGFKKVETYRDFKSILHEMAKSITNQIFKIGWQSLGDLLFQKVSAYLENLELKLTIKQKKDAPPLHNMIYHIRENFKYLSIGNDDYCLNPLEYHVKVNSSILTGLGRNLSKSLKYLNLSLTTIYPKD